ncbi:unnamed protein product [Mytilus edulis]|uniref:Uncharacterized protein n=1 Tax=Mytilus edulis TaxID=6550 RepID=A0A8S3VJF2_MYTED|nr:unnamed protein product [Mytilus edulis]
MTDPGLDNSVKQVIVQEVQNAVSASQQDTLNQITALIDNRLSTFQGNIQQSQRDIKCYIGQAENSFSSNVNKAEDKHTIEITQSKPSVIGDHFLLEVDIPVSPVGLRLEQNVQAAIDNSGISPDNKLRNLANKMSSFMHIVYLLSMKIIEVQVRLN